MAETVTAIVPPSAQGQVQQRWGQSWLIGPDAESFWSQFQHYQAQLQTQGQGPYPQDVMLSEPHPIRFLAALLAACQQPCRLWLASPQWGLREWQQAAAQCQPDLLLGTVPFALFDEQAHGQRDFPRFSSPIRGNETQILIPTGGSSGHLRFAAHTWATLAASVQGFQQHFHCPTVNAYCVLPLFHVSGLMQALRCWLSGGRLIVQSFQSLLREGAISMPSDPWFLSLVPTQLHRLLNRDRDCIPWLQQFTAILLGGAPLWSSLRCTALDHQLPLAPTYGMTETAAQVATLLPSEFLAGNHSSGRALPHSRITIRDAAGHCLPAQETGFIAIEATSLAQGYGQEVLTVPFQTGDIGYLDAAGYLQVLGRQKTLIITGGEKVLPEEVEAAILATGTVQDVAVLGIRDDDWGETVVAVVVPEVAIESGNRLRHALKTALSPYKIPKHWLTCPALPRNSQGKLNRMDLRQWVMQQLSSPDCPTAATAVGRQSGGSVVG